MFQSDYFLKKHGIVLNTNNSAEEQIFQMTEGFGVHDSESGDRPYIFISYAHMDSAVVLPAIKALQDKGYPVWYDAGIRPGTTWSDYIADHVSNAALVIAFMSKNAIASPHCQSEIRYAFNKKRPMLTVMLDQSQLPSGLDMQLSQWQMLSAHLYDGDTYISRLASEPFIQETAGAALNAYNAEKRRAAEEAARERKEAEEAERRRLRAEEEERERKEAEEAERRSKLFEAAKIRHIRLETLARQRREAEEAERQRREAAAAEIRRLEEEQAELESLDKAMTQQYLDPLEVERKYQEAEKALREERSRREEAERKLLSAQSHIKSLADAEKKSKKPISPQVKMDRQILSNLYEQAQEHLYTQTRSGYNQAIDIVNNKMAAHTKDCPELNPDVKNHKNNICKVLYHDARVLEEKRNTRKAYALYRALPDNFKDASERMQLIEEKISNYNVIICVLIGLLYVLANFILTKYVFSTENSFWFNALISVGPMIVAFVLWLICTWSWHRYSFFDVASLGFAVMSIVCTIICIIIDFIFYPEMVLWLRVLSILGYNCSSWCIGFLCALYLPIELSIKQNYLIYTIR